MAEARRAVRPALAVRRVGHEVDVSTHKMQMNVSMNGMVLFVPHPKYLLVNGRRALWQHWSNMEIAFLPVPLSMVLSMMSAMVAYVTLLPSDFWQRSGSLANFLWKIDQHVFPFMKHFSVRLRVALLGLGFTGAVTYSVAACQRYVLRRLLSYHGWMYEFGPNFSLQTKVWDVVLRKFFFWRVTKKLDAYQNSLPQLPVPELHDTVTRYLKTMQPLWETSKPKEWEALQAQAASFLEKEGPALQKWVKLRWLMVDNYVSDLWLQYVYLAARDSLAINSNWYGLMYHDYYPTRRQDSRAAAFVYNLLKIRRRLVDGTFEPELIRGLVPICMDQYCRIFGVTRIPDRIQDRLEQYEASRHIVVMHKGNLYRMSVLRRNGALYTPRQLEAAFRGVLDEQEEADDVERLVPVLTAANRTHWATIREDFFLTNRQNQLSLQTIERALFVVSLDDEIPDSLDTEGHRYLCGNGSNRWFDKSFTVVVNPDGKVGFNVEHSWGDALTMAHIIEWASTSDEVKEFYEPETGACIRIPDDYENERNGTDSVTAPERIRFNVGHQLRQHVESIAAEYQLARQDLDLRVGCFDTYGKGKCKRCRCGPDAWIQMAMQLAYFRDQGRFDQTYEAATMRLFLKGRTETIRSVSAASCAFVKAMMNPNRMQENPAALQTLLLEACKEHQAMTHDAMTGKGVDRHLFVLYCVAVNRSIHSDFLRSALSPQWKLSTSQVLTKQVPAKYHPEDFTPFRTPNGGFGPVADDGYGVSYCIFGEDLFYFNVSSKHSCDTTSSRRFFDRIVTALDDMANLFPDVPKSIG